MLLQFGQHVRIVRAAGDGFFKNCGVGCDACQAVLFYPLFQLAAGNQTSADIIKPDRLTERRQFP